MIWSCTTYNEERKERRKKKKISQKHIKTPNHDTTNTLERF